MVPSHTPQTARFTLALSPKHAVGHLAATVDSSVVVLEPDRPVAPARGAEMSAALARRLASVASASSLSSRTLSTPQQPRRRLALHRPCQPALSQVLLLVESHSSPLPCSLSSSSRLFADATRTLHSRRRHTPSACKKKDRYSDCSLFIVQYFSH
mmetsp:Transcript_26226/g.42953  ORF Transcript_26226/g.42953 Transcript_26226/m.42953 type:complete len:155 (+) Transcript_26226:2284-2748(+)